MTWPIYYKELIKISNTDSPVSIVTLWTIRDSVIEKIDPKLWHASGQLYTKNGINYLIRNLLSNKKIRYIILCGQDRSGSGAELKKIWNGEKSESLHKEIPENAIKNLVKNVELIDLIKEENSEKIEKEIKNLDLEKQSYGEAETFPEPKEEDLNELECSWPTDPSIFKVRGETIAETWLKALKMVLKFGDIKLTDGMKMKEICNLTAVIENEDPDNFYTPDWLGIDKQKIKDYLPQVMQKEKIEGLHYTYGYRMQSHFDIDQIDEIVEKLKTDKNAREAVVVLFDPRLDHKAEHRPCVVLVQTLFNKGKLNLNVYVRSHDIFGGWHLNAFGLHTLQKRICDETNLPMGVLTIMSASAHIYDFNWEQALNTANKNLQSKFNNDPRGYFKIEINKENKEILVKHFSPDGKIKKKYSENIENLKATTNLLKKIDEDLAISLPIHAADIGSEIQKAEIALRMNIDYTQDKPLNFS